MIVGDINQNVEFCDPVENKSQSTEQDLISVLKFYRRGDYFMTGVQPTDTSQEQYKIQQEDLKKQALIYKETTLMGVFFPVLNNIFGALLFIRQPELVGETGLGLFFIILLLCCFSTFSTSLSLSALCSNGRIRHGGTYFILSRALGAPLGTAIGFCYFIGVNINAANYILSIAETYLKLGGTELIEGDFISNMRVYGIFIWFAFIILNLTGLKYVSSAGILFMAGVIIGILGGIIGIIIGNGALKDDAKGISGWDGLSSQHCNDNWGPNFQSRNFITAMGIFYPAVTGILAGANRSGNIQHPQTMIPRGTVGAQLISSVTYFFLAILFACGADGKTLMMEGVITLAETTWPTKYLCALGIVCSAGGSAIENMAGAPRLLLGMYEDGNLNFLNRFKGNFTKIVVVNSFLILGFTMIGEIDRVTPLISMFILVPYVALNVCVFLYDTLQFPSWRPTFKYYNRWFSLFGSILSLVLMVVIGSYFVIVAFAVLILMYIYAKKESDKDKEKNNFGDLFDAFKIKFANSSIKGMISSQSHVKNWLPSFLLIANVKENGQIQPQGALSLLEQLKEDSCLTIIAHAHESKFSFQDFETFKKKQKILNDFINEKKFGFLTKVIQSETLLTGTKFLIQGTGLGGLEPNVIVTGFPEKYREEPKIAENFTEIVQHSILMGKAVMVTKSDEQFQSNLQFKGYMDIYCFSYEKGLTILMAFFLKRTVQYKDCKIRLYIITMGLNLQGQDFKEIQKEEEKLKKDIELFLERYRMFNQVEVHTIVRNPQDFENFLLQEYQKFMIGGKIKQIKEIQKLQLQEVKKTSSEENQLNQIAVEITKNSKLQVISESQNENQQLKSQASDEISQQLNNTNPEIKKEKLDFKAPEKFLSTIHSRGDSLNQLLKLHSSQSDLVILNLPAPVGQDPIQYLDYLRVMTSGIKRILFIKNESQEVITEYS